MYGINYYGSIKYNENNSNEDTVDLYIPDLMKYLPDYYANVKIMVNIQNAIAKELGGLNYSRKGLLEQFYIDTATWGLSTIWEGPLAIQTDLNKSYEERREIVKAKLRGAGTLTKRMIKNTAEAFSNGEVEVIEHPEEHYFVVKFIGVKGIPRNMAEFKEMLESTKPAHLGYEFQYNCTWWNKIKGFTWNQTKVKTWDELRVYE